MSKMKEDIRHSLSDEDYTLFLNDFLFLGTGVIRDGKRISPYDPEFIEIMRKQEEKKYEQDG